MKRDIPPFSKGGPEGYEDCHGLKDTQPKEFEKTPRTNTRFDPSRRRLHVCRSQACGPGSHYDLRLELEGVLEELAVPKDLHWIPP